MLSKLDKRITPEGCIYYSPLIIEIMRINEEFFLSHKPKGKSIYIITEINKSDWLTLVLVCLVNEVHYMYQLLLTR